jgi:hypothetical protein
MLTPKQRAKLTSEERDKLDALLARLTAEERRDLIDALPKILALPRKKRKELTRQIAAMLVARGG